MSKLNNLYAAMESLRKAGLSPNKDLEKQLSELEENIIKKEILPILTETIAPLLKQVKRDLVLVIDYTPDSPMSVHLSRKRNFTNNITYAKEILPDPKVEHRTIGKVHKKSRKNPTTRLRIILPNGKMIQEESAANTFCEFVKYVGVSRVRSLGMTQSAIPLISNTLDEKYARAQKPLGNGWYLMTNSNTMVKKRDIEYIAKSFGLNIKVEII